MQRTYVTAASIEFDAIVLATAAAPAANTQPGPDAKAADPSAPPGSDPRITKIVAEAWRHAKAIPAIGDGTILLQSAGMPADAPGVITGSPATVADQLATPLAGHRVWDRFPITA